MQHTHTIINTRVSMMLGIVTLLMFACIGGSFKSTRHPVGHTELLCRVVRAGRNGFCNVQHCSNRQRQRSADSCSSHCIWPQLQWRVTGRWRQLWSCETVPVPGCTASAGMLRERSLNTLSQQLKAVSERSVTHASLIRYCTSVSLMSVCTCGN
jgi:hypothetical protein